MKKRYLFEIAEDIYQNWHNITDAAWPYLHAMQQLCTLKDYFFQDSARSVVLYFLSNSTTWKGEKAKQIKTELKQLLNEK